MTLFFPILFLLLVYTSRTPTEGTVEEVICNNQKLFGFLRWNNRNIVIIIHLWLVFFHLISLTFFIIIIIISLAIVQRLLLHYDTQHMLYGKNQFFLKRIQGSHHTLSSIPHEYIGYIYIYFVLFEALFLWILVFE